MKTIFTLLLFVASFTTTAQTYTEMQVPNFIPMDQMIIEMEKDEAFHVLNYQSGTIIKTYLLINKTSLVYTVPTLPAGWSSQTLYKANKSNQPYDVGGTIPIIIDSFGNSYMRIH